MLTVVPVLIGSGIPLFGELPADLRLTLRGSSVLADGMVATRYDVHREAARR